MRDLRPLETHYNGYRFRSRLEARWAVFFDVIGITSHYEPQGYDIHGTAYLPDFYLLEFDCYAEVKPTRFRPHDFALTMALGHGLLLDGPPDVKFYSCGDICPDCQENGATPYACYCLNHDYGRIHFEQSLYKGRLWCCYGEDIESYDNKRFTSAVLAARGARFEHGEQP